MQVHLLVDVAGPMGVFRRGEDAELPESVALGLIGAGCATVIPSILPPVVDTTTLEPAAMAEVEAPVRRRRRQV